MGRAGSGFRRGKVAPGLQVGRGLEPVVDIEGVFEEAGLRPASGSGEDWNGSGAMIRRVWRWLRPASGSGEDWNGCPGLIIL